MRRFVRTLAPAAALLCASISGWAAPAPAAVPACTAQSAILASGFIYESAPYPQAHASTIAETSAGTLLAAWFGGTHERHPDVSIYLARQEGDSWQTPVKVADGVQPDGTRLPTWNPVLFQPAHGPLTLFYKVGPDPRHWWGMAMTSSDDGRSWSAPRRLPDGILGPIKNKPVTLVDGSWLAPSSTEREGDDWSLHFERSADGGRSWTATAPVASPEHIDAIQPSILVHKDGVLEAVARTRQGALAMSWSRDGGRNWSPLAAIDLPNPNSGTDAVTLKDGRQLLVYNHSAHYPDRPGKGPRYPLNVALSDDGVHWRPVLTLESKPIDNGYAYPAVIQARDGLVHVTYTHDRTRIRHVVLDPARLCDQVTLFNPPPPGGGGTRSVTEGAEAHR
ncbi:exo-alpha-sialidase [Sphingomonas cannabina]|uniref:sialidase family protein n=1 Tax=Sphingomonas cannabina TaxID=2899123 RepID=UPI001F486E5D|nr:exo-alpha-sialidase [Sphingomonas cannabina]UIJ45683.1 exo-alpha-sialidase [Sphingomonas cannabina]